MFKIKKTHIDIERIIERIEDIKRAVAELKRYQKMGLEEFLKDRNNFPIASYWLRIGLEAVLTIATHILSRLPYNGKEKDYTQVLLALGEYDVLPKNFTQKIKGMASYRNRLVHLYWKITPKELLKIIKDNLDDFEEFNRYIKKFLTSIK